MTFDGVEDIYPLSATQAGMVYHSLAQPDDGVYTGQVCFLLEGSVRAETMRATWDCLLQRHAALRVAILWDELEEPLQVIHQQVDLPWAELDWRDLVETCQAKDFQAWKTEDRRAGFQLDQAPLMRVTLIRLAEDRHWLVWTSHHAIADGWSVSILLREMAQIYQGLAEGRDADLAEPFSFNRYISWLQGQDMDAAESYWRQVLAGMSGPTELRLARPSAYRPSADTHESVETTVDKERSAAMAARCQACQVSLYTLMQAAWGILLGRYSGKQDVVFGVTTSGRPAKLRGIESAVGLFLNTLPVRHRFEAGLRSEDWLRRLQDESIKFLAHESTPLPKVNSWSEMADGAGLFDSILVMTNYPKDLMADLPELGWTVKELDVVDHSNYGLALVITPGRQLGLKLIFDSNRYSKPMAEQLLAGFVHVLNELSGPENPAVDEITAIPGAQYRLLAENWGAGPPLPAWSGNVVDRFAEQAAAHPERLAVSCGDRQLSYGSLHEDTDALAARLKQAGIAHGCRVGICLYPGVDVIRSILAVLKAGASYVPLDPDAPSNRTALVVEDADCDLLVSSSEACGKLHWPRAQLMLLDQPESPLAEISDPSPGSASGEAYVIYTSGSTGKPKGVAVTHDNLMASNCARDNYYPESPRCFLLLSAFFFDSSVAGIFWTLTTGGHLVVAERRLEQDMDGLTDVIQKHQVTHTLCLPSLYRAILDLAPVKKLASLRTVILAGESLPPSLLALHRKRLPDTRIYNEYGPTEATVWCTACDLEEWQELGAVPIGRPIPGAFIYIMDEFRRLSPPGVIGEICIGGPGVTGGYVGNPQATEEGFFSFSAHAASQETRIYATGDAGYFLPDGRIEFNGRIDDQLKIRGFRIELGEIEAALLEHADVREAAVMALDAQERASPASAQDLEAVLLALDAEFRESLLREVESLDASAVREALEQSSSAKSIEPEPMGASQT